jgi:hypothetical protein
MSGTLLWIKFMALISLFIVNAYLFQAHHSVIFDFDHTSSHHRLLRGAKNSMEENNSEYHMELHSTTATTGTPPIPTTSNHSTNQESEEKTISISLTVGPQEIVELEDVDDDDGTTSEQWKHELESTEFVTAKQ